MLPVLACPLAGMACLTAVIPAPASHDLSTTIHPLAPQAVTTCNATGVSRPLPPLGQAVA